MRGSGGDCFCVGLVWGVVVWRIKGNGFFIFWVMLVWVVRGIEVIWIFCG